MPAPEIRSSARVAPRSVIRVTEISSITFSTVSAGLHATGTGRVADGPEAHPLSVAGLAVVGLQRIGSAPAGPVARDDLALMGVVDRRQFDVLAAMYCQMSSSVQWRGEDADVLAGW